MTKNNNFFRFSIPTPSANRIITNQANMCKYLSKLFLGAKCAGYPKLFWYRKRTITINNNLYVASIHIYIYYIIILYLYMVFGNTFKFILFCVWIFEAHDCSKKVLVLCFDPRLKTSSTFFINFVEWLRWYNSTKNLGSDVCPWVSYNHFKISS